MLSFLTFFMTMVVMGAHVYYFINHPAVTNRLFFWLMSRFDIFWWLVHLITGVIALTVISLVLPNETAALIHVAVMAAVVLDIRRMRANG